MSSEISFFIRVLRDHIMLKKTAQVSDIDWNDISRLSRMHQLDGIIFYQCKNLMPEKMRVQYEEEYKKTLFIYTNRKVSMEKVQGTLRNKKIHCVEVKGFQVAQYYPIPPLRTMGDCDIVIPSCEIKYAEKVLLDIGVKKEERPGMQVHYYLNGNLFEIHDLLIRDEEYTTHDQDVFFNSYEKFLIGDELDSNFHFLFLIIHLRKHFINSGVGIRQFLDLAMVFLHGPELNWKWIQEILDKLGLLDFARACSALMYEWFEVELPIGRKTLQIGFFDEVTQYVIGNGVFGREDKRNRYNISRNKYIHSKYPIELTRIMLFLSSIFPEYQSLCHKEEYQYLENKPYFLPIAWGHRLILMSRNKKKDSVLFTLNKSFLSKSEIIDRKHFLEQMGCKL